MEDLVSRTIIVSTLTIRVMTATQYTLIHRQLQISLLSAMIEFTRERERGCTRLPLNWPDHFTRAMHPVSLKSVSIIGEEEARMSIMNSLERTIYFGNKITGT